MLSNEPMQGGAGMRATKHDALIVTVVDNLPAFGSVACITDRLAKYAAEARPSPPNAFEEWCEFQGPHHSTTYRLLRSGVRVGNSIPFLSAVCGP